MACDMCGKRGVLLTAIREQYKTDDIADLCDGCSRMVNDHLSKIQALSRKMNETALQRFMAMFKEKQ